MTEQNKSMALPDEKGFFGKYGGKFLPPELEEPFAEIIESLSLRWSFH